MANTKLFEFFRNILVLATLVGLVLFSWLFGHILRYSIPALWHPPLQETDPQIKVGVEFDLEGIRRRLDSQALPLQMFRRNLNSPRDWARNPQCVSGLRTTPTCLRSAGRSMGAWLPLQSLIPR